MVPRKYRNTIDGTVSWLEFTATYCRSCMAKSANIVISVCIDKKKQSEPVRYRDRKLQHATNCDT